MFGSRFLPTVSRLVQTVASRPIYVPKIQYSLLNKQTTSLLQKTFVLPSNIMIKNLLEMIEKLKEETDPDIECDVKSISLLSQGILRMSHSTVCSKGVQGQ